jgi:phage terminase large subunit-like protein
VTAAPADDPAAFARGEHADTYLRDTPADRFDWRTYIGLFDARLLADPRGRRGLTRFRPVLFALLYLRRHLTDDDTGTVTLAAWHVDWLQRGLEWCSPNAGDTGPRHADIAPRESGKTTIHYLVRPMWAAAHGHRRFIAAFSDAATQAEDHLATFKAELDNNVLLREDYHGLVRPARRGVGATMADRKSLYIARDGFVFAARGMDTKLLGMKIGDRRPDLLLLDDIEPTESRYSTDQKTKRLATLINAILPLAVAAAVQIVGTVTMPGSIIHDLVLKGMERAGTRELDDGERAATEWVDNEQFAIHHYLPLVEDPVTGDRVSAWPAKWSTDYLIRIEGTESYQLNYANDPTAYSGEYWSTEDIRILPEGYQPVLSRVILSIDPATKAKVTSDFTGLAVVGYEPKHKRCVTLHVSAVKISPGARLRRHVLQILDTYEEIGGILIEDNQGGDTWYSVFHDMPVPVKTEPNTEDKDARARRLLTHHQRARCVWAHKLPSYMTQLLTYPKGHDDMIDAEGTAVEKLLPKPRRGGRRALAYVR